MDRDTLIRNLEKVKELGCCSVHVGGGEPFLDPEGLKRVVETVHAVDMTIEYVETNSSWFTDHDSACKLLGSLRSAGLSTVLISMSPFHNEHIPFSKVKKVIRACKETDIGIFPWMAAFYPEIDAFEDHLAHGLAEYEDRHGTDYLRRLPSRYWIHFGGRALKTFSKVLPLRDTEKILARDRRGCRELLDTSHFHVDLFGNYVPGLCAGLAVSRDDLGGELSGETYPLLNILFEKGINGFLQMAASDYGFEPAGAYLSKCGICLDIRQYLFSAKGVRTHELQPTGFYEDE
jgi:hypothetical protein